MTRFATAAVLALVCLLAGCTKYYYQEGKTLEECRQDAKACYAEFKTYRAPEKTEEVGRYNMVYDYEGSFLDTCMEEKGYSVVSEQKLPLKVKREDPDRWAKKYRGLAGSLD